MFALKKNILCLVLCKKLYFWFYLFVLYYTNYSVTNCILCKGLNIYNCYLQQLELTFLDIFYVVFTKHILGNAKTMENMFA